MARALCVLACFLALTGAAQFERFRPQGFADASHADLRTLANLGVTIKKEFVKPTAKPHAAHKHTHLHTHAPATTTAAPAADSPLAAVPVLIDSSGILKKLLAGNVQAHGQPLAVPLGGKAVAIIISVSSPVKDLGDLKLPALSTAEKPLHEHHVHVHKAHADAAPPAVDHNSLLGGLLQPLISLVHSHGHAPAEATVLVPEATTAAPILAPAPPYEPVVVMLPTLAKGAAAYSGAPADQAAQLEALIKGLYSAKKKLLASPPKYTTTAAPAPVDAAELTAAASYK